MPLLPQKRQKFTEQPLPQYGQPAQQPQMQMPPQQDFGGLLAMINQGQQALLRQSQTPVSHISKDQHTQRGTPGLDQWYRNNPNAQVGLPGQHYGQSGPDVPAGPNPAMQSPQAAPDHAGGFMKVIGDGLMHLLGGGQQGGAQAPQGMQDQAMSEAQSPSSHTLAPQQGIPQQSQQEINQGGIRGPMAPQPYQGPMASTPQEPPKQLQTQEGFNNPPQQVPGMGLGGLLNAGTNSVSLGLAPQVGVNALTKNFGGIASTAAQNFSRAQTATQVAGDLAQGINGSTTLPQYAMRAAGSPAFNAALSAEQAAGGVANTALKAVQGGNVAMRLAGGTSALGSGLRMAGKVAAPIQAGMMLAEGGRLAFDPAFREQSARNYDSLSQKGAMAGLGQGLSAPISTIANSAGGLYDLVNNVVSDRTQREEDAVRNQQTKTAGNTSEVSRLRAQGKSKAEIQTAMVKFRKKNSTK